MKVNATVKETFEDQGVTFPAKATYQGEQPDKDSPVTFETGRLSSFRHVIPANRFSSVTDAETPPERNKDEDTRKNLRRVYVTPKESFEDQGVGFIPSDQYTGYLNPIARLVEFPTGAVSSKRHEIPFSKFAENLDSLYAPQKPETPVAGTSGGQ